MTTAPQITIKDIADGASIRGTFLVKDQNRGETKAGKPYLSLVLMDATGEIAAKVWERAEQLQPLCPVGAVVSVSAQAQSYKNALQLRIDSLERIEAGQIDFTRLVPSATTDVAAMTKALFDLAASIKNPFLKKLLKNLFANREIIKAFQEAPGAKLMHHACRGGLLEHTLAVSRLAEEVCRLYPGLDHSLLLSGAILHDLGKIREFDPHTFPFDYTDQGRLVGHMVLGIEMIEAEIKHIDGFPSELAALLKHLILSHHGRHEFGSPVLPMVREAFVLHFLDDLDAKISYLDRLAGQARGEGYQWTDFQRNLERFLFVRAGQADPHPPQSADQQTIFDTFRR